jgi:hypothetical protein
MKRFVVTTTVFLLLVLTWLFSNWLWNNSQHSRPLNVDATTLIVGDSHLMSALIPGRMENTENVCAGAESYLMTYYKLIRVLNDNPQVNQVLLGFSYNNFSTYQDDRITGDRAKSQFNRYYPVLPLRLVKYVPMNRTKFVHTYVQKMMLYPNKDVFPYRGGFQSHEPGIHMADVRKTINKHFFPDGKASGISFQSSAYLDSIISLCDQRNVNLVLVSAPVHQFYAEEVPLHIKVFYERKYEELLDRDVPVLHYINKSMRNGNFKDFDHLAFSGAEQFTEIIKGDLGRAATDPEMPRLENDHLERIKPTKKGF